jgi:hypothetical protein
MIDLSSKLALKSGKSQSSNVTPRGELDSFVQTFFPLLLEAAAVVYNSNINV